MQINWKVCMGTACPTIPTQINHCTAVDIYCNVWMWWCSASEGGAVVWGEANSGRSNSYSDVWRDRRSWTNDTVAENRPSTALRARNTAGQ